MKNEKSLLEVAPINVKYGGADLRRSAPPCQIPRLSGRNVRIQPPKTVKILIFTINCPSGATRLHYFYEILSVCTRLRVAFKFLVRPLSGDKQPSYKNFPAVGAFFYKYSVAPSGETTDRINKKLGGAKMGRTSSITMPSMVAMVGRAPAVDEKM